METPPLIAHIVHRFAVGGLENGIVNLINNMPSDRYRHAIISLTEAGEFKHRIQRDDVQFIDLHKKPGQDIGYHWRLWKILRTLKPAIVHTRNIGPMETVVTARLAGVSACVHGEHGWDMSDLNGSNSKYRWFRRLVSPFVTHYITMSVDIKNYMTERVGIAAKKVTQLYSGVDIKKFRPREQPRDKTLFPENFLPEDGVLIGMVGRMSAVKNPLFLARAFAELIEGDAALAKKLRLLMVGGGELHKEVVAFCKAAGIADKVWLPASRDDVPVLMRAMDVFVLPSHNEGISNTILEAMASGLPVIATNVGGNPELVVNSETGQLVASNNQSELTSALRTYANDEKARTAHGNAGRLRVEQHFSLQGMVANYLSVYDAALAQR